MFELPAGQPFETGTKGVTRPPPKGARTFKCKWTIWFLQDDISRMAIRFHCSHCSQLLSIASRQAGAVVPCPTCGQQTRVPEEDPAGGTGGPADSALAQGASGSAEPAEASLSREGPGEPEPSPAASGPREVLSENPETIEDGPEPDAEEGFQLRKVAGDFSGEMDLTPMVDVTFLLLIFFMVTASFSLQKSIEVPPPDPEQQGAMQSIQSPQDLQENAIIVQIDERNAISIDYEPVGSPENLAELLADRRRVEQKSELVIDAAAGASHGTVVMVNDAAVEAQFQRIRLAVRADESN